MNEENGELRFVAPREFSLALESGDLKKLVEKAAGRPLKISVSAGEGAADSGTPAAGAMDDDQETERRALAHQEIRHFRELFPGSQVRTVRNLKQ